MTLGGLALAIGILVDEATVEVENIHAQLQQTDSVAMAVRMGNARTAVPRLLAMLCVLAVFIPAFFMKGAAKGSFAPLALAVGFAMIGSYILSSTFVPVVSVCSPEGASSCRRGNIAVRAPAAAVTKRPWQAGSPPLAGHRRMRRSSRWLSAACTTVGPEIFRLSMPASSACASGRPTARRSPAPKECARHAPTRQRGNRGRQCGVDARLREA